MADRSQQESTTSSFVLFPTSECIAWVTVFAIQAFALVTLNALVIVIYLKERSLRKRSMYMVINQAVADMLVGGAVIIDFSFLGFRCDFWTINTLSGKFFLILGFFLFLASMTSLAAISLERTHATFRPFKHRLIKKKVFGAAVAAVWITAGLWTVVYAVAVFIYLSSFMLTLHLSIFLFFLLIVTISYSSIAIKIVCASRPHHHTATRRERKLTKTLFIVTVLSLLLWLPLVVFWIYIYSTKIPIISYRTQMRLSYVFSFLSYTNCLVNPVLYAFRIPEFKRALFSLLRCRSQPQPAQVIELN